VKSSTICHCERSEAISMEKQYYVDIMTNKNNRVLYTGITNDLMRRAYAHREKLVEGFTTRYNVGKLVYFEIFRDVESALLREKQIKGGPGAKKLDLINGFNKDWRDLYNAH
jgi:putative endonuclease